MPSDKLALVFPGRARIAMACSKRTLEPGQFEHLYRIICDVLGYSLLDATAENASLVNTNLASSMLTVLASCLA